MLYFLFSVLLIGIEALGKVLQISWSPEWRNPLKTYITDAKTMHDWLNFSDLSCWKMSSWSYIIIAIAHRQLWKAKKAKPQKQTLGPDHTHPHFPEECKQEICEEDTHYRYQVHPHRTDQGWFVPFNRNSFVCQQKDNLKSKRKNNLSQSDQLNQSPPHRRRQWH